MISTSTKGYVADWVEIAPSQQHSPMDVSETVLLPIRRYDSPSRELTLVPFVSCITYCTLFITVPLGTMYLMVPLFYFP